MEKVVAILTPAVTSTSLPATIMRLTPANHATSTPSPILASPGIPTTSAQATGSTTRSLVMNNQTFPSAARTSEQRVRRMIIGASLAQIPHQSTRKAW